MRVTFRYENTGREKVMSEREADILTKLGHGKVLGRSTGRPTYQTRDMQAAAPMPATAEPVESDEAEDGEDEEQFDDITEARSLTDTQEPGVAPKRRGRPPKDPK